MRTSEIKNEIDYIKKWEGKINQKELKYKKMNVYMSFNNLKL